MIVNAPLLSVAAKGQFGRSIVSVRVRGIDTFRLAKNPTNPRSSAQTKQRSKFALAKIAWSKTDYTERDKQALRSWARFQRRPLGAIAAFCQQYIRDLRYLDDVPIFHHVESWAIAGGDLNFRATAQSGLDVKIFWATGWRHFDHEQHAPESLTPGVYEVTLPDIQGRIIWFFFAHLHPAPKLKVGVGGLYSFAK